MSTAHPRRANGKQDVHRLQTRRPRLEQLEGRLYLSGAYLVVGSFDNNSVLRYDESTGAFVDQFDPNNQANLKSPVGGIFGTDGDLYVTTNLFEKSKHRVLQYDGTTGAFQQVFASQNVTSPRGVLFGPDGNLYVLVGNSISDGDPAMVLRFDGKTGAFLDDFVTPDSGGLEHPSYMVFGPNGTNDGKLDLYVAATHEGAIYRYDGTTGAFKSVFVPAGSGGLDAPQGMVFGRDGDLYVASGNWFTSSNGPFYPDQFPPGAVLRFQGPAGPHPGSFVGTFVAGGTGGLGNPAGMLFGPDGNLYVASAVQSGNGGTLIARPGTSQVLRYDGTTGAFQGAFVTPSSGGLKFPTFLAFTETDPTTLNYNGHQLLADSVPVQEQKETLGNSQMAATLAEAERRWELAGVDPKAFANIDVRVANLGGRTVGQAVGRNIWLDDNAAGWGWFVDPTPNDDIEFRRPGNQGEQNHLDLLTAVMHELGHLLGYHHTEGGVMAETLAVGVRPTALKPDKVDQILGQAANQHPSAWLESWLNQQSNTSQGRAKRHR